MYHAIHDRPAMKLKIFGAAGVELLAIDASGDAWGDGVSGPYGHDYPIAPGHYMLDFPEHFGSFDLSEGWGQIPILDIDRATLSTLVNARKAVADANGSNATIGGITLPIGGLAAHDRGGIMVHGGGSNLGLPAAEADYQPLCKTEGCTRVHNADWQALAGRVTAWLPGNVIVWSAVGDPAPLSI